MNYMIFHSKDKITHAVTVMSPQEIMKDEEFKKSISNYNQLVTEVMKSQDRFLHSFAKKYDFLSGTKANEFFKMTKDHLNLLTQLNSEQKDYMQGILKKYKTVWDTFYNDNKLFIENMNSFLIKSETFSKDSIDYHMKFYKKLRRITRNKNSKEQKDAVISAIINARLSTLIKLRRLLTYKSRIKAILPLKKDVVSLSLYIFTQFPDKYMIQKQHLDSIITNNKFNLTKVIEECYNSLVIADNNVKAMETKLEAMELDQLTSIYSKTQTFEIHLSFLTHFFSILTNSCMV